MMKKIGFFVCLLVFLIAVPVMAEMDYTGNSGFTLGYLFLNNDELQDVIANAGYPAMPDGMLIYGGTTLMGYRDGLRWGGFGYGGELTEKGGNDRLTRLTFSLGGANLDYGFVLSDKLDIALGGLLGGGSYELTLRGNALSDPAQGNVIHLTNSYFVLGPRATVSYQATSWLAIEGLVGYLYGIGSKQWTDVDLKTSVIPGMPINSPMVGISLNLTY